MLKYFQSIKDSDVIYSIDMLRLNFDLYNENVFNFFIDKSSLNESFKISYNLNHKSIGYKHLWSITIEEDNLKCTFVIGLELNCLSENKKKGFIEFNPNKCMILKKFNNFYNSFIKLCSHITLVRYDLAIDLSLKRDLVKMIRQGKSTYQFYYDIESKRGLIISSSITEYQGQRSSNKFCKLYDKTKESHLNYDLTRIEFTFDREEVVFKNLPKFYVLIENNNINGDLSTTQSVLVQLLRETSDLNYYLSKLDYRIKEKILPYLCDYEFNPSFDKMLKLRDWCLSFEK